MPKETMISTGRLLIRRFRADDWRDLHEYLSQPGVVEFEPYEVFTKDASKVEAARRAEDDGFWAVCLGNKVIGNAYLKAQDFDTWELGYVFNQDFQQQGYATEAVFAIVDHAFRQGAHRVVAMCNPLNERSWKLLDRLGFRLEGTLRQNIWFKQDAGGNPIWLDTYQYGILASEW